MFRLCINHLTIGVEADDCDPVWPVLLKKAPQRQTHLRARIIEQECKPLRRIGRVERDVYATGLKNCEHRHNHFGRTFKQETDAYFRPDSESTQVMGQTVRTLVEFVIADGCAFKDECRC
jgi:hypothetical protein